MTAESFARQNAGERLFAGLAMPPRVVTLPFPDKVLSPNARVHWARKAKATKAARDAAFWLTWQEVGRKMNWQGARISLTFCPPDKRRRDADNLLASCKGVLDGISDALGLDDSKFETSFRMGEPVKGGSVRVEIRGIRE